MTRKTQARAGRWFGIGMERPKTAENLGVLWRSAVAFGASFVFTVGERYHPNATDTVKSWRHVPCWRFESIDDYRAHIPRDCVTVGVELGDESQPLETFPHPRNAVYLLGPEDGSLSNAARDACQTVVEIDTRYCLNLAAAGTVVMYDRCAKGWRGGVGP